MHSVEWDNVTISTCVCSSIKGATETLQMLWHRTFNSDTPLLVEKKHQAHVFNKIQSTLVISKSKGPAETLRDIRTSTYQMCKIEENTKRTIKVHK